MRTFGWCLIVLCFALGCTRGPAADGGDSGGSGSGVADTGSSGEEASSSGAADTTGAPVDVPCDVALPYGGVRAPSPGSGVSIDLPAVVAGEVADPVELTDAGATIRVTVLDGSGRIESELEPVEVPGRYVFSPVFEITAAQPGLLVTLEPAGVPESLLGGCAVAVVEVDGTSAPVVNIDTSARFVLASACDALTCNGECASGIAEDHCGSCSEVCDGSVCFDEGCAGQELGLGEHLTSDGSQVWWACNDACVGHVAEFHVADASGEIDTQPTLGFVQDIAGNGGAVVTIEDGVVRRRAPGMAPVDLPADYGDTRTPIQVGFDDTILAVMLEDFSSTQPTIVVRRWDDLDAPLTPIDGCLPTIWIWNETLSADLSVAGGVVYVLVSADTSSEPLHRPLLRRCDPQGAVTDVFVGDDVVTDPPPVKLQIEGDEIWALVGQQIHHGFVGDDTLTPVGSTGGLALAAADDGAIYCASEDGQGLARIVGGESTVLLEHEAIGDAAIADGVLFWGLWGVAADPVIRSRPLVELAP